MNYQEVNITFKTLQPWRDIVVSQLAEVGFESFVETKTGVQCYIAEPQFNEQMLDEVKSMDAVDTVETKTIVDQNWNAEWEKNFPPVIVEDKLAIIAPFHEDEFQTQMTIVIQPQMSFGTGHHQTTWLASKRLFELNLEDKTVLDMGTGTGILAILAEKLGAKNVFAPDIDEWSYENALENVARNNGKKIEVAHGGHDLIANRKFDLIIANINKNILIKHFADYAATCNNNATLLISGFFTTDQEELKTEAAKVGFVFETSFIKDEWALMQFRHQSPIQT